MNFMRINFVVLSIFYTMSLASPVIAESHFISSLINGKISIDNRYRYEFVDQGNFFKDAYASTLRTRVGYTTADYHDFFTNIELENITQVGNDTYNDTINNRTDRPTIADPESSHINQLYVGYKGGKNTQIDIGRKRLEYDNYRFVGVAPWRQNERTFDLAAIDSNYLKETRLRYAYLHGINHILGTNSPLGRWKSNSHLINIANTSLPVGTITGYGYLLDFEEDKPLVSSQTYGLSLTGEKSINDETHLTYRLEYAYQSDYGQNPTSYQADYYKILAGLKQDTWHTAIGYEVLGSDNGNIAISTPIARLHRPNGWADMFVNTPANGLRDLHLDTSYKLTNSSFSLLNNMLFKAQYHHFLSDHGQQIYGNEFDIVGRLPITKNLSVQVKYAHFEADDSGTNLFDRQRVIFDIGFKL